MNHKLVERAITLVIIICIVIIPFSCTTESNQAEKTVGIVEDLMNNQPDNALKFPPEGIEYPEILNIPLYYKYGLLPVRAKNKNNKEIAKDTVIRDAAEYFTKTHEIVRL